MSNTNTENKNTSIGAFYEKTSSKGLKFLSGFLDFDAIPENTDGTRLNVVLFKNNEKKSDKSPDWSLFVSKPLENQQSNKPQKQAAKSNTKSAPAKAVEDDEDSLF